MKLTTNDTAAAAPAAAAASRRTYLLGHRQRQLALRLEGHKRALVAAKLIVVLLLFVFCVFLEAGTSRRRRPIVAYSC